MQRFANTKTCYLKRRFVISILLKIIFNDSHLLKALYHYIISRCFICISSFIFPRYLIIWYLVNFVNICCLVCEEIIVLFEWNRGVHCSRALRVPFSNSPRLCQEQRKPGNCIVRGSRIPLATASRRQLTEWDWCRATRHFETGATIYRAVLAT